MKLLLDKDLVEAYVKFDNVDPSRLATLIWGDAEIDRGMAETYRMFLVIEQPGEARVVQHPFCNFT